MSINLISQLKAIVGEAHVLTGADTLRYAEGSRDTGGRALCAVRPSSTSEVSQIVALCVKNQIHIVPQSGNTGVVAGSTPDATGTQLIISLDRIKANLEIDEDNRSVRADAGFSLAELNDKLASKGLFFPIDLGSNPLLGGMLATNTGGARFLRYGDVRRNTLGIKVVLADEQGTVLDLMVNLRKNNSAIDWKHIFIGSCGYFGIITECELTVENLPSEQSVALLVPRASAKSIALLKEFESRSGGLLSAFEGMSHNALASALRRHPNLRNPFPGGKIPEYVILVELSRSMAGYGDVPPLDEVLQRMVERIWEESTDLLADAYFGSAKNAWALRHTIADAVKAEGLLVAFDLAFTRGNLFLFCDAIKARVKDKFNDVGIYDFGHIGDGGVHFNLVAPPDSQFFSDPTFETEARRWVYDVAVKEFGGSFSGEHGIGRKNQAFYDLYTAERLKILADRVKSALSPGRIGIPDYGCRT